MPTKKKKESPASLKKMLLLKIEEKLLESLAEFPKKINENKYKKVIHKAAILIAKDLTLEQSNADSVKNKPAKENNSELTDKPEPVSAQII